MGNALLAVDIVAFLSGDIFGYLLHAGEVAFAEILFGIFLKKRKHFVLRLSAALVVYLTLSVLFGLLFQKIFPYGQYVVAFLLSILLLPICFEANIWDELFCIVAAVAMQNLSYSTGSFVVGLFGWDPIDLHWLFTSLQVVLYAVVHVITFLICAKRLKNVHGAGEERFAMVIISLILTLVVYAMQNERQSLEATDFLWWRAMFISYDILTLFMLFGMYDRNQLRRENAILDSLRASEERKYEFDKRAIEMVNIKCHDLKHQLIALRGMGGGDQERALKEIEDAVLIYDSIAKTGCKPLDVILSSDYLLCERYGIRLTYMIDGEKLAFMKATDIYSLFGNALDNAIRAERGIEDPEKRFINILVSARGRFLTMHIENYYDKEVVFRDGVPLTTKSDEENHGFGIISIKRIVEQYGGVFSVECAQNMFCLDITIPLRAAQSE